MVISVPILSVGPVDNCCRCCYLGPSCCPSTLPDQHDLLLRTISRSQILEPRWSLKESYLPSSLATYTDFCLAPWSTKLVWAVTDVGVFSRNPIFIANSRPVKGHKLHFYRVILHIPCLYQIRQLVRPGCIDFITELTPSILSTSPCPSWWRKLNCYSSFYTVARLTVDNTSLTVLS